MEHSRDGLLGARARGRRRRLARAPVRARCLEQLLGAHATWAVPIEDLLGETREVDYKQTARWNVRAQYRTRALEDIVAKTFAGTLNDHGSTRRVGVTDDSDPVSLHDH